MTTKTEFVTTRQWHSYANRLERKNLKEFGTSLTALSIINSARNFVVEVNETGLFVKVGWRDAMKQAASPNPPLGLLR